MLGDISDMILATVELAIDAEINENVSGHILLLYEEDDTEEFTVDEGVITVTSSYGLSLSAGKMYVPFGVFTPTLSQTPLRLNLARRTNHDFWQRTGLSSSRYPWISLTDPLWRQQMTTRLMT